VVEYKGSYFIRRITVADNVEVTFQTLKGDLVTLNRAMLALAQKLPKEDAKITAKDYTSDEALKEALNYGGYFAQHLKQACADLKDGVKPTSISLQVGGVVVTWDISQ
jgi:hypothetical protein